MPANAARMRIRPRMTAAAIGAAGVVAIAFSVYDFASRYVWREAPEAAHAGASPAARPAPGEGAVQAILKVPFFGKSESAAGGLAGYAEHAPATALRLELKGVVAAAGNSDSGAIIAEAGK